jgi:hypothetical protein
MGRLADSGLFGSSAVVDRFSDDRWEFVGGNGGAVRHLPGQRDEGTLTKAGDLPLR